MLKLSEIFINKNGDNNLIRSAYKRLNYVNNKTDYDKFIQHMQRRRIQSSDYYDDHRKSITKNKIKKRRQGAHWPKSTCPHMKYRKLRQRARHTYVKDEDYNSFVLARNITETQLENAATQTRNEGGPTFKHGRTNDAIQGIIKGW